VRVRVAFYPNPAGSLFHCGAKQRRAYLSFSFRMKIRRPRGRHYFAEANPLNSSNDNIRNARPLTASVPQRRSSRELITWENSSRHTRFFRQLVRYFPTHVEFESQPRRESDAPPCIPVPPQIGSAEWHVFRALYPACTFSALYSAILNS